MVLCYTKTLKLFTRKLQVSRYVSLTLELLTCKLQISYCWFNSGTPYMQITNINLLV